MYSTEGGMDIEEVAHKTPERIFKEWVYPGGGLQPFQARKIAFNLQLSGEAFKNCVRFVTNLYNCVCWIGLQLCWRLIRFSKQAMKKSLPWIAK